MERFSAATVRRFDARGRQGAFVAVVGPSGAGKDTLLRHASERLAADGSVHFVRRVITREADGATEDHDTLSPVAFERARADGAFALCWEAHGLSYGLPVALDDDIGAGRTVVANVSRSILPALKARYRNVAVVFVTASAETLTRRLMARGRESAEDVEARLARSAGDALALGGGVTTIANDGTVDEGGNALVAAILSAGEMAAAPVDV